MRPDRTDNKSTQMISLEVPMGNKVQPRLATRPDARFFRGMVWCGGLFLAALFVLIIQQVHIAKTFAAHLAAGGVDDPDAVFGHLNPLILVAPLAVVVCFSGLVVCAFEWLHWRSRRR